MSTSSAASPAHGANRAFQTLLLLLLSVFFISAASAATALTLKSGALPTATAGTAYSAAFTATGGTPPYTWALQSGGLPDGLKFNANGTVTGTPLAETWEYSYPFSLYVKVTDSAGKNTAASYTIKLVAPTPSAASNYTLTVVNGSGGGSYAANASVTIAANAAPAGQVFQKWTGATVANATAASTTLTMPSANATVTANYAAATPAAAPLAITTTGALPAATVGTAYSAPLTATGGVPPYTWALTSGAFPDGLALGSTGTVTGNPLNEGSWVYNYPFAMYVTVTDSASHSASASLTIAVLPPAGGTGTGTGSGGGTGTGTGTGSAGSYTVTVTNGTANGAASSVIATGTTVTLVANAAPAGQYFQQWNGNAQVLNSFAATTTFTMPASNVTVAASYYTPAPVPQPVATHPRLWITPADLPKYQAWATASNPVYLQGLVPLLNQALSDYNTKFFPNGQPNPVYPDLGDTQGYQGLLTEQESIVLAFNSLIDPSPAKRILYAQDARNLVMYAMNEAAKGPLSGAPFRDPLFALYNRANFTSEAWPLVVDWIYNATDAQGNPILTAADKLTIRDVFVQWANACLNAYTTGGDHPAPIGVTNSTSLLPGGDAYRMASNNYYLGHARLLTLMALALDPADDPAINPAVPAAVLGNTLRSYIPNATGAWLYQEFAMLGDANTVRAAYGLAPTAKVGLASGGLPPEGMLYGHSYSFLFGQLLALKTAGFADPTLAGPQVALANNAPVWDRFVQGMAASLVPAAQVYPGASYMGPVYQMACYGDILRTWMTPDFAQTFSLLGLLDQQNGVTARLNAERWFVVNVLEGGSAALTNRVAMPWSYGVQDAILTYLILDPTAPAATDPRPGYATAFYDASQGRLVEHTDWTANATMFDFRCSWISINHQQADANQFEFYRKGEWLTKGVANYDNNIGGLTTDYHNTLSLKNWCQAGMPANLGWWEGNFWVNGSQWQLGGSAGDPTATVSVQPAYTFAYGDTTNLYNRPSVWSPANAALDIQHASRSILWLKPDHIVVYDRATSKTPGLFKRFNLAFTAMPTVSGNVVTTTTSGGQHLYVSNLLPAGATITAYPVGPELNPIAELEPTKSRIAIETSTSLTDVRFLHVLQGADAAQAADATALVQSTAGTAFDGALILDTVVMFKHDIASTVTTTTYTVPATTAHHYVTDLAPNTGYTVTVVPSGATLTVTIAAGGATQTDSAGVLTF